MRLNAFDATLSLVTTMFAEGPARNRALGLWSVSGAAGLSLGSLLGGALTGAFGWPAVFWVNLPLAAVAWTGAWVLLPADRCRAESGRGRGGFDIAGAVTGTCGITLLVFALAQGERWGWTSARVVGCAVAALVLLAGFAAVESRAREPLVPPRLVRTRARTLAVVLAFGATAQSLTYFLTLYLQDDLGFSPVRTGVAFLAPTLAITAGNLLGERAIGRWGVRATLCAGLVTSALGSAAAALVLVLVPDAGYTYLLAGVVCHGLGTGTTFTALWVIVGQGVRATEQGTASGLGSTALQCGAGIGLALLVPVGETRDVMWLIAAGCLAAAALVLTGPRDEARHPAGGAALPDHPPLPARTAADHDTIEGTNEGGPWTAR
ncbi:MFS transporter [Uniformispora flossi]|uniref:MFS transporter n=1 Tax=Uniformispora flossi TaxID=3390723 RepID=UPI003C2DBE26